MEEKNMMHLNDQDLANVSGGTGTEAAAPLYHKGQRIRFHNVLAWDPSKVRPDTLEGVIYHVYDSHPAAGGSYIYFYGVEFEFDGETNTVDLVEQQIICALS